MSDKSDAPASAKEMLQQLITTLSQGGVVFRAFLQHNLADNAKGAFVPHYNLNKAEIIEYFYKFFAKASGGSVSMLNCVVEGGSGCCRFLLTSHKEDISVSQSLKSHSAPAIEGVIWVELRLDGKIGLLNLGADLLSAELAKGKKIALAGP